MQTTPERRRAGPAPASGPDRGPGRRLSAGPEPARPDLRPGQQVLADRAHDADYVREQIALAGAQAVIPSQRNRKVFTPHDDVYKNRNQIERCFNRFKAYRAIATRFEKNGLGLSGAGHASRHPNVALIENLP